MPIPEPKQNEEKDEYIARCLSFLSEEDTTGDQAKAICFGKWEDAQEALMETHEEDAKEKSSEAQSLNDQMDRVRKAWRDHVGPPSVQTEEAGGYIKEIFEDRVIVGYESELYSVSYSEGEDGEIEFGEPAKVEIEYRPVKESRRQEYFDSIITPRFAEAEDKADFEGREWDVTIIGAQEEDDVLEMDEHQYVRSKNGRLYDVDALKESVELWEGVKVYDNHLTDEEFAKRQGMRSVAGEWIGSIVDPEWHGGKLPKLTGTLKVVEESVAKKLKAAWDQDVLDTIGLSIDTLTSGKEAFIEGKSIPIVEGFRKIISVDLVAEPAAGGGFNRLIAAITDQEVDMTEEELKKLIAEMVPNAVAEALAATESEELEEEEETVTEGEPEEESPEVEAEEVEESEPEKTEEQSKMEERLNVMECRIMLRDKLDEAKLPDKHRRVAETAFAGRVFEEEELDRVIDRLKEAQSAEDESGRVTENGGGGDLTPTMDGLEKAEMALLDLIGGSQMVRKIEHAEEDWVQERIPEAYNSWVNAGKPNYRERRLSDWLYNVWGGNPLGERAREGVTTSSVSTIVKNTVNLLLAADYSERRRWFEDVAAVEEVDTIDDVTLGRVYGVDTLDVVDEGNAYTEMDWEDEEETGAFVKKGNYISVTLETMLKDKLNKVRSIPRRLSDAWYNTQSALVSGVFTVNSNTGPVMSTGNELFNSTALGSDGHANLATSALSYTTWDAAVTAMMKQTDQTSGGGQKLLIQPRYVLVPVDLRATALQIRNSEYIPASMDNDINPHYQGFDVVVVPEWTDSNNWAAVADPARYPAIYLIYLRGLRTPEIFEASDENSGAMFTNDSLRFKVRLMTFRDSSTYDCAPVADWRPCYKSNV